jgi:hypothetical protein
MVKRFILPAQVDWTIDELSILPDEFRYELVDGRLDIQQRAPLVQLAALGLMATLKDACPAGFRVEARPFGWWEGPPVPDIVVRGPGGADGVVLAVDVAEPGRNYADMLARTRAREVAAVPIHWVVEVEVWRGARLTVFRRSPDGRLLARLTTHEVFAAQSPFHVMVDLPSMSARWPVTFEYEERSPGRDM